MANDMVMKLFKEDTVGNVMTVTITGIARWQINENGDLIVFLDGNKTKAYTAGRWLEFDVE